MWIPWRASRWSRWMAHVSIYTCTYKYRFKTISLFPIVRSQSSRSLSPTSPRRRVPAGRPIRPYVFPRPITSPPSNRGKRISYRTRWKTIKIEHGFSSSSVIATNRHNTDVCRHNNNRESQQCTTDYCRYWLPIGFVSFKIQHTDGTNLVEKSSAQCAELSKTKSSFIRKKI